MPKLRYPGYPGRRGALIAALMIAFFATDGAHHAAAAAGPRWHRDYYEAVTAAKKQKKMLLIFARATGNSASRDAFRSKTLRAPTVAKSLRRFVLAELPLDVRIKSENRQIALFEDDSFEPLEGRQGLVIIDYAHRDLPQFGCVVSAIPFPLKGALDERTTSIILNLPPGTITQRTLIYAVRIHDEKPASTSGELHVALRTAVEKHSQHQADIESQGHHNWGTRFHRISARLPMGMSTTEICAESWPNQGLVAAAIDCVHSWRQSSGHWGAVSSRHTLYAYDMKQGSNGVWYATGIFANRR